MSATSGDMFCVTFAGASSLCGGKLDSAWRFDVVAQQKLFGGATGDFDIEVGKAVFAVPAHAAGFFDADFDFADFAYGNPLGDGQLAASAAEVADEQLDGASDALRAGDCGLLALLAGLAANPDAVVGTKAQLEWLASSDEVCASASAQLTAAQEHDRTGQKRSGPR